MCEDDCQCYLESDEYKSYWAVEEQMSHCTPSKPGPCTSSSTGVVRGSTSLLQ